MSCVTLSSDYIIIGYSITGSTVSIGGSSNRDIIQGTGKVLTLGGDSPVDIVLSYIGLRGRSSPAKSDASFSDGYSG